MSHSDQTWQALSIAIGAVLVFLIKILSRNLTTPPIPELDTRQSPLATSRSPVANCATVAVPPFHCNTLPTALPSLRT
jgi:hypothetical protein